MSETTDAAADVRARYERFARDEAPGRSALYGEWAAGVAADPDVQALLAGIPANRRQPPLVFAVTRMLGAPLAPYPQWTAWLRENADAVAAECVARSVQTNEPLRCAALLPALALVEGPVALLEVGAAAGLCLYPDRYSYRYRVAADEGGERMLRLDPVGGSTAVVLECDLRGDGAPPLRMPRIVWRAGIDRQPLDARDDRDRAWLRGLVWPGEAGREERIAAALDIAAADPPHLIAGDAAEGIAALAAGAPREATLVITTPGVLPHIPRDGRERLIAEIRALVGGGGARWITLDDPALHDAWSAPIDPDGWPGGGFALALDGDVLAAADPLGRWLEWRVRHPASAA